MDDLDMASEGAFEVDLAGVFRSSSKRLQSFRTSYLGTYKLSQWREWPDVGCRSLIVDLECKTVVGNTYL